MHLCPTMRKNMLFAILLLLVAIYSLFIDPYRVQSIPTCTSSEHIAVFFPAQTFVDATNDINAKGKYVCVPRAIGMRFHPATSIVRQTGEDSYRLHNRYPRWFDGRRILCQDVNVTNCIRLAQIGVFCDTLPLEITFDNSVSMRCVPRHSLDGVPEIRRRSDGIITAPAFCGHPASSKPACHAHRTDAIIDDDLDEGIYNLVEIHTSPDGVSPTMKNLCSL